MTEITTDKEQEYCLTFNAMTEFLRSLGLTVKTNTKARGHQGFFLKNRIDISASIPYKRKIEVLIHEFTHYIHAKIDPEVFKNHGTLESLFPGADIKKIQTEMLAVTRFVDTNKSFNILNARRNEILEQIKQTDKKIKSIYPDFKRSYAYPKFEKVIKKTDAKYLLKYDKVRVKTMFTGKTKDYSTKTLEEDFPQFEESVHQYIRLKAQQRALKRVASRISRLNSYYNRPTELFARFVEGLFIDTNMVSEIAPYTYLVFCKELAMNRYLELADFINKFF